MTAARRVNWARVALATTIVAAIGGGLALALYLSSGPEFVAAALERLLGRRVEIEELELYLSRRVEVELRGVKIYDPHELEDDGIPAITVERARGRQSWPRILVGQLLPLEWELDQPHLRLSLGDPAGAPQRPQLTLLRLVVRDGTLEFVPKQGPPLFLANIQLEARRTGLTSQLNGAMIGELRRESRNLGHLSFDLKDLSDDARVEGDIEGLQLADLPVIDTLPLSARVDGRLVFRLVDGGVIAYADLRSSDLKISPEHLHRVFDPREARLRGEVSWRHGRLRVRPTAAKFDDLEISGILELGSGGGRRVRGELSVAPFDLGTAAERFQLLRVIGLRHASWARFDERLESGRIEEFKLDFNLPVKGLDRSFSFGRKLTSGELSLAARISNASYRHRPGSDPIEGITSDIHVRGNVLEVHDLNMSRGGNPYPEIELRLDGMHRLVRLPADERAVPPGPGVPIPGLEPAFSTHSSDPNAPPLEVMLDDFRLLHPAFVLPIRNLSARLTFPDGGIALSEGIGVFGGVPARMSGTWDRRGKRVAANIEYLEGTAPPYADPGDRWADGHFWIETLYLGTWRLENVAGELQAKGHQVEFHETEAILASGPLSAQGSMSLAEKGFAPYEFDLDVRQARANQIRIFLGMDDGTVSGSATALGSMAGRLQPEHRFVEYADVDLQTEFMNGEVEGLPASIALARLPSLSGVRALFGQPLPYDSIAARLRIRDGMLLTEDFALTGPELRMLAAGEIDLMSEDLTCDMTVALLFLQTVDWMIDKVPIFGEMVLGKDGSLVALYLQLEGPWGAPEASLVAPDAIQAPTDWATRMIGSGMVQLRKLFGSPTEGKTDGQTGKTKDQQPPSASP